MRDDSSKNADIINIMSAATVFHDLGLPEATIKALGRKARVRGKTARDYVRTLIEADLLADKTFDEILAPVREGFRKSGVTEKQWDALIAKASRPRKIRWK